MRANTDNSGAQDRCTLVLNLAGTACKNDYYHKHKTTGNCCKYHTHFQDSYIRIHSSCVVLNIRSDNILSATFHCIPCSCRGTRASVNTSPHSPHHKAWYSSEVQATSCRTVRGNIHSPPSQLYPQRRNSHRHHLVHNCHHPTGSRA